MMGIAGDAARERVRLAERPCERPHCDPVGAAHGCRRAGHGGTQHVHPGVAARHHTLRCRGGKAQRADGASGAGCFRNAPNEPAARTQFGDAQELIGIGGDFDRKVREGRWRRNAGCFGRAQVGDERGEHRRQFLGFAGASFMVKPAVHSQHGDAWISVAGEKLTGDRQRPIQRVIERAGARECPERIIIECALPTGLRKARFAPAGNQRAGGIGRIFAGLERNRADVEMYAIQSLGNCFARIRQARLPWCRDA